ncbi:hypothetical protein IWQ60_003632 [Tieghemiomyces parasiticus]|uniref:Uncharacterized protein n=1 Tax=Tieghemiomyces parasiticus TaxID=78921 RepID=A0A9W8A9V0_9FUNG|nr:hypothetical protein IWQ60_003632 [Tieghemiomyces parasiticus]
MTTDALRNSTDALTSSRKSNLINLQPTSGEGTGRPPIFDYSNKPSGSVSLGLRTLYNQGQAYRHACSNFVWPTSSDWLSIPLYPIGQAVKDVILVPAGPRGDEALLTFYRHREWQQLDRLLKDHRSSVLRSPVPTATNCVTAPDSLAVNGKAMEAVTGDAQEDLPSTPPFLQLCFHGAYGNGLSHFLGAVQTRLRQDPTHRVLYLPSLTALHAQTEGRTLYFSLISHLLVTFGDVTDIFFHLSRLYNELGAAADLPGAYPGARDEWHFERNIAGRYADLVYAVEDYLTVNRVSFDLIIDNIRHPLTTEFVPDPVAKFLRLCRRVRGLSLLGFAAECIHRRAWYSDPNQQVLHYRFTNPLTADETRRFLAHHLVPTAWPHLYGPGSDGQPHETLLDITGSYPGELSQFIKRACAIVKRDSYYVLLTLLVELYSNYRTRARTLYQKFAQAGEATARELTHLNRCTVQRRRAAVVGPADQFIIPFFRLVPEDDQDRQPLTRIGAVYEVQPLSVVWRDVCLENPWKLIPNGTHSTSSTVVGGQGGSSRSPH